MDRGIERGRGRERGRGDIEREREGEGEGGRERGESAIDRVIKREIDSRLLHYPKIVVFKFQVNRLKTR